VMARSAQAREHLEMGRFLAAPVLDGRLAGALALARAELALAEGRLDDASTLADDGIAATLTSGDDELRGRLALVGVRAADDRVRSLDRRTPKRAQANADGDRDRCIRLVEDVVRSRVDQPGFAPIAAELAAWSAPTDDEGADAWLAAAAAWRDVEWPRLDVRARTSAAAALIRSGQRAHAAKVLAEAAADALAAEDAAGAAAARRIAERAGLGRVAASTPAPSAVVAAPLTAREREVLELVSDGATNRRIATTLFISEKTASVHVSRILTKLGVGSRHAAAAVHRRGLRPSSTQLRA
jgi:DNA-binding NarL/FixJ family response regulator